MLQIASYFSDGRLNVLINGKRYTYYGVSPHQKGVIEKLISLKAYGRALDYLKQFSDTSLHKPEGQ